MKVETVKGITRLTADEGMVLTNGATSGAEVWLSPQDSADNWREMSEDALPEEIDPESIITELEGYL